MSSQLSGCKYDMCLQMRCLLHPIAPRRHSLAWSSPRKASTSPFRALETSLLSKSEAWVFAFGSVRGENTWWIISFRCTELLSGTCHKRAACADKVRDHIQGGAAERSANIFSGDILFDVDGRPVSKKVRRMVWPRKNLASSC